MSSSQANELDFWVMLRHNFRPDRRHSMNVNYATEVDKSLKSQQDRSMKQAIDFTHNVSSLYCSILQSNILNAVSVGVSILFIFHCHTVYSISKSVKL
jgi:hypothetical protein